MAGEILSISPSKLETFRKYYDEEYQGFITEEKLIQTIIGETFEWSEAMVRGSAYHKVIEHGAADFFKDGQYLVPIENRDGSVVDTIEFSWQELQAAEKYRSDYPGAIFEVNHEYKFPCAGHIIHMNMFIDTMWGNEIHDHKTTDKPPGGVGNSIVDSYHRSLQWKIYMVATGASLFRYNIFQFTFKNEFRDVEKFSFYLPPEKDMFQQMKETADMYIRFCKDKNLMKYIIKK